ncbi:MAG: flavin reductase family protein, partial [Chloroflexota bacterium]|nr:flavin reductase family protein [Chloroflexota bacterium]
MFYQIGNGTPDPFSTLNAIVVPRPIGWISTLSADGVPNLAPYSFFNAVAYSPPQVMFAATSNHRSGGLKDAVLDAQTTGEFVVNVATWELRKRMNASAVPAPREVDEFEYVGLTKADSRLVKCPRVAESPIHLECRYIRSVEMLSNDPEDPNTVVFGEVVGVNIDERVLADGRIDFLKLRPVGRLGYLDFVEVDSVFTM